MIKSTKSKRIRPYGNVLVSELISLQLSELNRRVDGATLIVIMTLLKEGLETITTLGEVKMDPTEAQ